MSLPDFTSTRNVGADPPARHHKAARGTAGTMLARDVAAGSIGGNRCYAGLLREDSRPERVGVDVVLAHERPEGAPMLLGSTRRHCDVAFVTAEGRSDIGALEMFDDFALCIAKG